MSIYHLQHNWMSWEELPSREERVCKNLWTTSCFIKFLCSNWFPEFMYFTSCAQAFRKRSLSLMGPSPLLSPAKQHQVMLPNTEITAVGDWKTQPQFSTLWRIHTLCQATLQPSHQEVETFPFSDPWSWLGFITCYDRQNAVDGISVLALSLDL